MLNIFINTLISSFALVAAGTFFKKNIKLEIHNICENALFGAIFIAFLSLTLNFILPIDRNVSNLIFILLIIFFILKNYKNYHNFKNIFLTIIYTGLISTLIITLDNIYRPDAGLYHLPYTNIINQNNIIIGLANIHFRFGHISITQYLSAHLNNYITNENAINIPHSILASAFIIYLFTEIKNNKKFSFYFFFIFFSFLFSIFYLKRYSEYGNDAPGFIFSILTIISYLKYKNFYKQKRYFYLACFFATYAFFIKSFFIIIFLITFFAIDFKNSLTGINIQYNPTDSKKFKSGICGNKIVK